MKPTRLVIGLVLAGIAGCGPNGPETFPARGQVVYLGHGPVPAGVVEFDPVDGGPAARARIAADGSFELTTAGGSPGAPAGRYRIAVLPPAFTSEAEARHMRIHAHVGIAAKYARPHTSGIELTVEPKPDNRFVIELDPAN